MKQLLEHFAWKPSDNLLSLGCGSGWWEVNLVLHQPCHEIILVDTNSEILNPESFQENIDYFENKLEKNWKVNYQLFNQPLDQLPLATHSIDGILLFNSWHELDQLDELIQTMKQVLKPGGWILLEEELSVAHREIHQGCGKVLYFQEEIDLQMARGEFQLDKKVLKEKQSFYLKYLNR